MLTQSVGRHGRRSQPRRSCATLASLAILVLPMAFGVGCDDTTSERFRTASMTLIGDGLTSLAQGIITGIVTLNTPQTDATTSGSTSTGGSTTTQ